MKNRMPKYDIVEKRTLHIDKSKKERFCGYCGTSVFGYLNGFLLHVNLCEVKDNDSNQPALI
jgi:hypothetical protein